MNFRSTSALIGSVVLVLVLLATWVEMFKVDCRLRAQEWLLAMVTISYGNYAEQDVTAHLGEPQASMDIRSNFARLDLKPHPSPPREARRVLVYKLLSETRGLCIAYVYVDGRGKVVGVQIGYS